MRLARVLDAVHDSYRMRLRVCALVAVAVLCLSGAASARAGAVVSVPRSLGPQHFWTSAWADPFLGARHAERIVQGRWGLAGIAIGRGLLVDGVRTFGEPIVTSSWGGPIAICWARSPASPTGRPTKLAN